MVRIFLLVLVDLWQFLINTIFGIESKDTDEVKKFVLEDKQKPLQISKTAKSDSDPMNSRLALMATPDYTSLPAVTSPMELPRVVTPVLLPATVDTTVAYCMAPTAFLLHPYHSFDGKIDTVSYGQSVLVRGYVGRYAEVMVNNQLGYIEKDMLTVDRATVWPSLIAGTKYAVDQVATTQIRLLIGDEFQAGLLGLELQAGEYVLWRLLADQLPIAWPSARPRLPGNWHQLLRGHIGIKMGVEPLADSIIEWVAEDGDGRVAYVEQVWPDKTIQVSGVGIAVAGEFSQLTLPISIWREWRPVFIVVS